MDMDTNTNEVEDLLPPPKRRATEAYIPLLRKPWNSLDNKNDAQTSPLFHPNSSSENNHACVSYSFGGWSQELIKTVPVVNEHPQPSLREIRRQKGKEWAQLIDEQNDKDFANLFEEVAVQKRKVVERGSETYSYTGVNRKSKRKREDSDSVDTKGTDTDDVDSELSDVSDTGLDEDDKQFIASNSNPTMIVPREDTSGLNNSTAVPTAGNSVGVKRTSFSKLAKIMENVKDESLGRFIAARLREKNKLLIDRCVNTLGRDYCVHIFRKTMKIECQGGLKIKNNSRRRTPGGVFLYIIRMDRKNSQEILDRIFIAEPRPVKNQALTAKGPGQNKALPGISILDSLKHKMTETSRYRTKVNPIHPAGIQKKKGPNSVGRKSAYAAQQNRIKVMNEIDASSYSISPQPSATCPVDKRSESIISYDDLIV